MKKSYMQHNICGTFYDISSRYFNKENILLFLCIALFTIGAMLFFPYDASALATSAVWNDADNGDEVISNGDTLTITFDTATDRPGGVTTNSTDFIFVTEFDNNNVKIFDSNGDFAGVLSTTGGTAFSVPYGVTTNSTDFIFVSDVINNNVQIFDSNGDFAAVQPTTGGTAFSSPQLITIDNNDRLIVQT